MGKRLLVLFDGNALIHRAYHALPPFTVRKTGEVVGAVYGFASMLIKVLTELNPTDCAIAFDKKGRTFRHELFHGYKAQRPATPDELVNQIARVRQVAETFGIPIFEVDGYEADDVLGALSKQASEQDIDTIIVTGDADTMQLVSPRVKVLYPKPGRTFSDTMLYDEAGVLQKYGVRPEHIADFKALVGDPSDNIPGVRGIGEKTAVKLIQQFGGIEQIYEHLDEVKPPKLQALLRENEAVARQSKQLATIVLDVPVNLVLENCAARFDRDRITELFRELEFYSLLSRLPKPETGAEEPEVVHSRLLEGKYHLINDEPALIALADRLSGVKSFALAARGTTQSPMSARLIGIAISPAEGEAYYVPARHESNVEAQLSPDEVISRLRAPLEDEGITKVARSGKYESIVFSNLGALISSLSFDISIAAHLLGESSQKLNDLALSRLGLEIKSSENSGAGTKQLAMFVMDIEQAADLACSEADVTLRLAELFEKELNKQGLWQLFSEVEMPLMPVLVSMEQNGVTLDTRILREMSQKLGEQLADLEHKIYDSVGHQFNINSPQQLGGVLFGEIKLPTERKGKNRFSTEASVLEELRGVHPVVNLILDYRQLAKLKSTYVDALPGLINERTGRVHTSFNQTRTATGRLSSSEPNLQNIPIRGEMGKQIRKAFVAREGSHLLAGDYSQIDLRVLAHLSQDAVLLDSFQKNEDIHAATAAQLFNIDTGKVTPDMRRLAKTVNFGVIYGMSEYGLQQATELSREEAAQFIHAYFEKHPGVKQFLESTKQKARDSGYVQTLLGRRRFIPEIHSPNRILREAAERMAINMPVQGTSADIIKVAMINLCREMDERAMKSKMLLQVHDELLFEVPENELEEMRRLVPGIMTSAIRLSVPLRVDIKIGASWGDME